jgi:hypothetical protein
VLPVLQQRERCEALSALFKACDLSQSPFMRLLIIFFAIMLFLV